MDDPFPAEQTRRVGELERLGPQGDDILVLGVDAPGFDQLSPSQRCLAYCLYRAAIPGNRIAFFQAHRDAWEIKHVLEQVYRHSDGIDGVLREQIHEYLKYVWVHHGQYHHYTHTKFAPHRLTASGLRNACTTAIGNGAAIPVRPDETMDEMLSRLEASIFDAGFEPVQTNQTSGIDIVATSAVNYWDPDVTAAEIDALPDEWSHRLNVRYARRDGKVVPDVYRVGGLYGEELEVISHFLRMAVSFAESDAQRAALESLLAYYATGDENVFREHMIHWLGTDTDVDYLNGFIEVYMDPRGSIGHFEANVSFRAGGGLIDRISENALYFERRMPWPENYRRRTVARPVANVVNVIVEVGDSGPVSPAAYNLPNYNDIRRDQGSKNVILENIENAGSDELLREAVDEFYLPEYRDGMMRYFRDLVRPLQVYMHEIIGHGSGQPDPALSTDPRVALGRVYSALEECRADLVALYHFADPKLIELGAFHLRDQRTIVETSYIGYLQGWFSRLDRISDFDVREAHDRGHHTILNWLLENGGDNEEDYGLRLVRTDDAYFLRIEDLEDIRGGLGALLSRIQVIKSTGDGVAAEDLFDRYGSRVDADWKADVARRRSRLLSPRMKAFVFPRLIPIIEKGLVVDANMVWDEDLTAQQLRFSDLELSRDLVESPNQE